MEKHIDLSIFTGSDVQYRHPMFGMLYTEGVRYLATEAGAYWLIDAIFSHQVDPKAQAEEYQVWTLIVDQSTNVAVLTMSDGGRDGRGPKTIIEQKIEYTDLPLSKVEMWFANDTLYLPSEH